MTLGTFVGIVTFLSTLVTGDLVQGAWSPVATHVIVVHVAHHVVRWPLVTPSCTQIGQLN